MQVTIKAANWERIVECTTVEFNSIEKDKQGNTVSGSIDVTDSQNIVKTVGLGFHFPVDVYVTNEQGNTIAHWCILGVDIADDPVKKNKPITADLVYALKSDEDLFLAYRSNIAMAFQDEYSRYGEQNKDKKQHLSSDDIHKISNWAAFNFLNLLCETQAEGWKDEPEEKSGRPSYSPSLVKEGEE